MKIQSKCRLRSHWVRISSSHYDDVIMGAIASQITSLTIVYSTVYSDAFQRKHQSSTSLAFVRGIHRGPVNSPHKWPVTRKMSPFDDVIMIIISWEDNLTNDYMSGSSNIIVYGMQLYHIKSYGCGPLAITETYARWISKCSHELTWKF